MHPNCRSTTRGYLGKEAEKMFQRRAKNPITGEYEIIGNISYKDWYNKNIKKYGKEAVDISYKKIKYQTPGRRQHEKYKDFYGKKIPSSFEKFQEMKYNNINEYSLFKDYYVLNKRGFCPKDLSFDTYKSNINAKGFEDWQAVGFNPNYIDSHKKHLSEFNDISWEEYENKAKELLNSKNIERFVSDEGTRFVYNKEINEFAIAKKDGTTQTYYKPTRKEEYWKEQKEKYGSKK